MTNYSSDDYVWVKKVITRHTRGMSVKDIIKFSHEEGIRLGSRPRDEKPPGREKIYQIVKDYAGKDWHYDVGGGKRKHSVVKPMKVDPLAGFNQAAREMVIGQRISSLDDLYKKREKTFRLLDIITLFKIRESITSYPIQFLYIDSRKGHDKDVLFNRALVITKEQIKKIKRIETIQRKKNGRFDKTFRNLEQIMNSNLLEAEIVNDRKKYKNFLNPRNTIQILYGIK